MRASRKHQLAEILVSREKHPLAGHGELENDAIRDAGGSFGDRDHVMSSCAQRAGDRRVAAFICEEAHGEKAALRAVVEGRLSLATDGIRGIRDCGLDVFVREVGVRLEEVRLRRALRE